MRTILSTSEVVGTFEHEGKQHEYCASADATYNESTSTLVVKLDCFARPIGLTIHEDHWYPDCLPRTRQQTERVPRSEAVGMAREIFHSWVNRIRSAVNASTAEATGERH